MLFRSSAPAAPSDQAATYWLFVAACGVIGLTGSKPELTAAWKSEFLGSVVIVATCFTPGRWFGVGGQPEVFGIPSDWIFHATGVVLTDWTMGGPHVNPSVTLSFWLLGKIGGAQCAIHMAAQTVGAAVGVHLCQAYERALGLLPIAGPEIAANLSGDALTLACWDEFAATALLLLVVYAVNFEAPSRFAAHWSYYILKQYATAIAIRGIIILFPSSGPALNPALATGWLVASTGTLPDASSPHWLVYWLASFAGAIAASVAYALYTPRATIFGRALRKQKRA